MDIAIVAFVGVVILAFLGVLYTELKRDKRDDDQYDWDV